MSNRTLEVKLFDLLDVVVAAKDFGYADDVLLSSLADWSGYVNDKEIKDFANDLAKSSNVYTEEDKKIIQRNLKDWRNQYCKRGAKRP